MNTNGWIKLHRQIVNNWIWEDADKLKAWLDILLMVNHDDKKIYCNGKLITIKRGEKLTSIKKLSERWSWTRRRVMRFLDLLEEDEMCTTNRTPYGTTLKVVNYADYQGFSRAKRTGVDTTDDTTDDTPLDTQTRMSKKNKNIRYIGATAPVFTPPTLDEISSYCQERNNTVDPEAFFDYYKRSDWKLTRGGRMTDWKATVRSWERNNQANKSNMSEKEAKMRRAYDANIIR